MSADFSASHVSSSRVHYSPPSNKGIPSGREGQARPRDQVLGPMMQNGNATSPRAMAPNDFPKPSPDSPFWQSNELHLAVGGSVSQPLTEHSVSTERQSSFSPNSNSPHVQSLPAYGVRTERQSSRSPNMHLRTPSQLESLAQENAQLRRELEDLRAERDQTQNACDNMLTELMTTQDSLQETQAAIAEKDVKLSALREQLARWSGEPQGNVPDALRPGRSLSRNEEQELRDLRLKCSRLEMEAQRKDEHLKQARAGMLETDRSRSPHNPRNREILQAQERLRDAEERAANATHFYQTAQNQVDTYLKQIMDWKNAYDALQASHSELQRSYSGLSRAAQETRSRVDDQAVQQLQASQVALNEARQMTDFWKQNSEKLSKKNKDVTDQIRNLQDALNSKSREFDQQKSMIEALQLQMT